MEEHCIGKLEAWRPVCPQKCLQKAAKWLSSKCRMNTLFQGETAAPGPTVPQPADFCSLDIQPQLWAGPPTLAQACPGKKAQWKLSTWPQASGQGQGSRPTPRVCKRQTTAACQRGNFGMEALPFPSDPPGPQLQTRQRPWPFLGHSHRPQPGFPAQPAPAGLPRASQLGAMTLLLQGSSVQIFIPILSPEWEVPGWARGYRRRWPGPCLLGTS